MTSMWIARDRDNTLWLYTSYKPSKDNDNGYWTLLSDDCIDKSAMLPDTMFPELTWEDEPIEVSLISNDIRKNFTDFRYLGSTDEPNILKEFVRYDEVKKLLNNEDNKNI